MAYRLIKGPLSKIRNTISEVKELQAAGFVLDGECDKNGNVISTVVIIDAVEAEEEPATPANTRKAKKE